MVLNSKCTCILIIGSIKVFLCFDILVLINSYERSDSEVQESCDFPIYLNIHDFSTFLSFLIYNFFVQRDAVTCLAP